MPGYYGVKLGRHWNGLKIEIWDLQDLHSNTVNLVLKGEIIFTLKIIKTHRATPPSADDGRTRTSFKYKYRPPRGERRFWCCPDTDVILHAVLNRLMVLSIAVGLSTHSHSNHAIRIPRI